MTLYLLFERMESGKISLDTQMNVSEEASSQAPTKLGLRPGDTLKVDDAIKGLVGTKSANDAAVVIAEALAGWQRGRIRQLDDYAQGAHALGMRNTIYRNPNGLPNDEQVTTARDQALLGIAIQERFPKQYRYFSLASFVYHGNAMRNHNHLLGKVEGVDGIKTGFTRDSGFNLVTSVRRGPRHIVAVVLGGRSASSRDARMRDLIEAHIAEAVDQSAATALVAEGNEARIPTPRTRCASAGLRRPRTGFAQPVTRKRCHRDNFAGLHRAADSGQGQDRHGKDGAARKVATPVTAPKPEPGPRTAALVAPSQESSGRGAWSQTAGFRRAAPDATPCRGACPDDYHPGVLGKLPAMMAAARRRLPVPSAKADLAPPPRKPR